jgi:hypothetical protein
MTHRGTKNYYRYRAIASSKFWIFWQYLRATNFRYLSLERFLAVGIFSSKFIVPAKDRTTSFIMLRIRPLYLLLLLLISPAQGFVAPPLPASDWRPTSRHDLAPLTPVADTKLRRPGSSWFSSSSSNTENDDDANSNSVNPYADPNYPDLEFVNYDDPEYSAGQDGEDDYLDGSLNTEEQVEAMREERRRRNDEYQFQTYWTSIWGAGDVEYKGEWTVYYSNTFFPEVDDDGTDDATSDEDGLLPRLIQASEAPLSVISRATKELVDSDTVGAYPVDAERIRHTERLEQPMGDAELALAGTDETERHVLRQTYWPEQLAATDFRGPQGIMVCGKYVMCDVVVSFERVHTIRVRESHCTVLWLSFSTS